MAIKHSPRASVYLNMNMNLNLILLPDPGICGYTIS
jgi:hypothetical protein